jgi:Tfp pilus assembly protein PilF
MSTEATNREAAVALAEALGNLPLALEQAAAYAGRAGISLSDYLALFRERASAYTPPASKSADYPDALAVTFEIAFARLREESPAAADLLTLCAFLAPDDMPLEIFKEGAAREGDEAVQLPEALAAAATPDALAAAAATLQAYALAKVRGGSFLSVHRLTQAVARDRLDDDERKSRAETVVELLYAAFPFKFGDTRTWPPSARLLQHALTATEHVTALGVAGEAASFLLNEVGTYLLNNAEWDKAKAALEKSISLGEELLGPTHPELAAPLNNISQALLRQNNLDEAAEYLKRALAIDEAALGPDHPNIAIRLNNIGSVLYEKKAYAEARERYERALVIAEAAQDAPQLDIAAILNNIGTVLDALGDHRGACSYYERAVSVDEKVCGPNHPNVAIDLDNLALAMIKLGEMDAARQYLERALRIFRQHWGENHHWTVTAKEHLKELDKRAAGGPSSE